MSLADIDTIVVVMLENRSFDHMLGYLSLDGPGRIALNGLKSDGDWQMAHANRWPGKPPIGPYRLGPEAQKLGDPKHDHAHIQTQVTTAPVGPGLTQMGGFVQSAAATPIPQPDEVMGYYDAAAVPTFDFFARNYLVCDRWFAALPCGTQPNRLMAMAGESKVLNNAGVDMPDHRLVYDWLDDNKVSWCAYQKGGFFPFFTLMKRLRSEILHSLTLSELGGRGKWRRYHNFAQEWAAPEPMPSVIFIEPEYSDGPHLNPTDDHAPTGIAKGQAFLADIYGKLISNPARWARTMMIVTYDEHGGFFDHEPPIGMPPLTIEGTPITTSGVRVPAFVVSPQVKAGVFSGALDHTSILQLLADKFAPGEGFSAPVTARQANLRPLQDVLAPPDAAPRAPKIAAPVLTAVTAAAAAAPMAEVTGAAPDDPETARALHNVALEARASYPDLLAGKGWERLNSYLDGAAKP